MSRATELSIAFLNARPAGAARVLEQIAVEDAAAFIQTVPAGAAAAALSHMHPVCAASVMAECKPTENGSILLKMPGHARSLLLRALPERVRTEALATLSKRDAAALRRHIAYAPGTVGAWMDAPAAVFATDTTVGECLQQVRGLASRIGSQFYVVDENAGLRGAVGVEDLLGAEDGQPLEAIMQRHVMSLPPQAALSNVLSSPAWDHSLSLPVVDRRNRLLGVLHFQSLREGLVADHSAIGGTAPDALLVHILQALAVSVSGLLQVGAARSAGTRIANDGEH